MVQSPIIPPQRHIPYKKGGLGAAILTVAVTVGAYLTAFYIHERTYRHPRDIMMREAYEAPTSAHEAATGTPAATPENGAHQ